MKKLVLLFIVLLGVSCEKSETYDNPYYTPEQLHILSVLCSKPWCATINGVKCYIDFKRAETPLVIDCEYEYPPQLMDGACYQPYSCFYFTLNWDSGQIILYSIDATMSKYYNLQAILTQRPNYLGRYSICSFEIRYDEYQIPILYYDGAQWR